MNTFCNKKLLLTLSMATILSTVLAEESRAEVNPNCNCSGWCECHCDDGTNCCMCYIEEQSCGSNCSWSVDNGVLKITGSGTMNDFNIIYQSGNADDPDMVSKRPWDEYRDTITAVEIDGISNVGKQAFDSFTNLKSVTLGESVKTIGFEAFYDTGIESIDLSNVETLEEYAFESTHLKHAVMPDNISVGEKAFYGTYISDCGKGGSCGSCNGYTKSGTGCVTDCGEGYTANAENQCIKNPEETPEIGEQSGNHVPTAESCYANGQVFYKEQCWDEFPFSKKKWTPADAAQWLNEDDNTVTITFKK